jgi:hypothetical protein
MSTQSIESEVRDRLEIVDTLYRFAAGLDFNDLKLLESVFTADVVVDFRDFQIKKYPTSSCGADVLPPL